MAERPLSNAEWANATKARPNDQQYVELAKRNDPHFAPPTSGAPGPTNDHKIEWRKYHQQALIATIASTASGKSGVTQEAMVLNGFAAHFLTDAFAAGHLVNKDDAMAKGQAAWKAPSFSGIIFKESAFTKSVARRVLSDPTVAALMAKKQLKEIDWGDVSEQRFSEFIYQISDKKPAFFNAFARLIHDKLNESIKDPSNALEVTNARGHPPWKLSGDKTLSDSPETLRIMQAAVAQSYSNLEAVAKLTATPSDQNRRKNKARRITETDTRNTPGDRLADAVDREPARSKATGTKPRTFRGRVHLREPGSAPRREPRAPS